VFSLKRSHAMPIKAVEDSASEPSEPNKAKVEVELIPKLDFAALI